MGRTQNVSSLYLCQFENVFLSVNDLQCSIVKPPSNVTRVCPAIFIQEFSRLLRVFEVSLDYVGTFEADLRNSIQRQSINLITH